MKKIVLSILPFVFATCLLISCTEDDLEPTLEQEKNYEGSITKAEDLKGLLKGAYNRMTDATYYGRDYIIYGEIRADNCFANGNSGRFTDVARMSMTVNDAYANDTWEQIYRVIASANIIIGQELGDIEGAAPVINHYIGQAYALRALAHFDLLKLFGQQHVNEGGGIGIPYITEYKAEDRTPARNTVEEVKDFIEADLDHALEIMSDSLDDPSAVYLTTNAVHAIKSRVALYFSDWSTAANAAATVINSTLYNIVPKNDYIASWHTDGAVNSIFELAFSEIDNENINGLAYIYRGAQYGDIQCLDDLKDIFEPGDIRADSSMIGIDWIGSGVLANLGKYPSMDYSDNVSIIRFEEMVLNYVEAMFELEDESSSLLFLNLLTAERGTSPYTEVTKENILLERRKELCFEGFRYDDLVRNELDIPLVSPLEQTHGGPAYGSGNLVFPIPVDEINANSSMVQNKGYN